MIQGDFGDSIDNFEEEKLLSEFNKTDFHDWVGSTWPPCVVSKRLWDKVGGYSEEFSPGMYSDPDFSMKLWQEGVRHFKVYQKVASTTLDQNLWAESKRIMAVSSSFKNGALHQSTFTGYYLKEDNRFRSWRNTFSANFNCIQEFPASSFSNFLNEIGSNSRK